MTTKIGWVTKLNGMKRAQKLCYCIVLARKIEITEYAMTYQQRRSKRCAFRTEPSFLETKFSLCSTHNSDIDSYRLLDRKRSGIFASPQSDQNLATLLPVTSSAKNQKILTQIRARILRLSVLAIFFKKKGNLECDGGDSPQCGYIESDYKILLYCICLY